MVKPGYKQTEIGILPEDWKIATLEDLYRITSSKRVFQSEWRDAGVPFYRAREIAVMGEGLPAPKDLYISDEMYERYSKQYGEIKENDVLITGVGTLGKVYVVKKDDKFYFKDGNIIWLQWNGQYSSQFLKHLYCTTALTDQVFGNAGGSTVPTYTITNAKATIVPCPDYAEQCEIADVLSEIDALIATTEKQLTKKKAINQGAMQELLTGKKRLPGFSGEWISTNLGTCLTGKPCYGINAPAVDFNSFLPRYIRITDITEDGRYSNENQASVEALNVEPFALQPHDIVLARTGASVGKSYLYRESDGRLVYAGFLIKISIDPHKADSRFVFGVLHTYDYWKWVAQTSMRSGQPGINGEEYASYEFQMPSDLKEQNAIADILTNMDDEIEMLEKKLVKYRQVKQGMMQQLLTGKIRLV